MDVIIANGRLGETLLFAKKLGTEEAIVLFDKPGELPKTDLKLKKAILVKNVREAQKNRQKYDYVFGIATRELIESKAVTHVYSAETLEAKDKTHRRGSGLNQVLAKLIKDTKKTYCFDLRLLLGADQATMLGRMQQNKKILKKYGCKNKLYSFAQGPLGLRADKERKLFLDGL